MIINQQHLKQLLSKNKITKSALRNNLGISSRTIAKISKGENVSSIVVNKIANFFGVDVNFIAGNNILNTLQIQKSQKTSGDLYHETQIKLTYNSNHIEGSKLTEDQTRYIFSTKTLGNLPANVFLDDVIETNNHFLCVDYIIDFAKSKLTQDFIFKLHYLLKQGTQHANVYGAGQYKTMPNTVGGIQTTLPQNVVAEMQKLLQWYNSLKKVELTDIVEFHYRFEIIHPFQDGNGRIGRLIAFKECLKNNIIPFYIDDNNKWLYYRGLKEWTTEKNYLIETCKFGQDQYKMLLDYFKIEC